MMLSLIILSISTAGLFGLTVKHILSVSFLDPNANNSATGTWCDHKPNKHTMIGKLAELMVSSEFQKVKYYPGIGTYSSFADRFVGGKPYIYFSSAQLL
jgi:hypothetical protein